MARERPTASDVIPPKLICLDGGVPAADHPLLTRAEAHALRRSARLTHSQLEQHLNGIEDAPLRPR